MRLPSFAVKRYHVTTFGCQMNAHDSERIKGMLEELGLGEALSQETADVLVFNTCTIREKPDTRLAATLFLGTGRSDAALAVDMNDPAVAALVGERDAIEQQIGALRLKKASMDQAAYDADMEKLLTSLALKTKALRDRQTKKDER